MTERSFVERIVAILGVLVGTVIWVARFLFSMLKDAVGRITGSGAAESSGAGDDDAREGVAASATSFASNIRSKGESLKDEASSLGQTVAATAREKVGQARDATENLVDRGEEGSGGETDTDANESGSTDDFGKTGASAPELTSVQHEDIGGIPEAPAFASAVGETLSGGAETSPDSDTSSTNDEDEDVTGSRTGQMREGIPNLDEPGGDTGDVYGSEAGALLEDEMPEGGYAGQIMQGSDIGQDRGDEFTGLAEGEEILPTSEYDRTSGDDHLSQGDEIDEDEDDVVTEDDEDVPAASRGWQGAGAGESLADEDYDDLGVTLSTDEIDYANDEADEDDSDGMHIVDSPDESFVVEETTPAQSIGLADEGGIPVFDTEVGEPRAIDADDFAADALGNRMGGDAASGDLGPIRSADDATWDPGSSEPDYDIQDAYAGSGVDEFESDEVARDMLDDVGAIDTDTESGTTGQDASGEDAGDASSSVAWATSSGVVQEDLTRPLSPDELQGSGEETPDTDAVGDAGEPGLTEKDAGWRDAASQVAEQLDGEMGDSGAGSSGTTMSGAGQSAGAMTSDDAVAEGDGVDEMTSDTGTFATGGTTAPEAGEDEDQTTSGEGASRASMGVGSDPQFNEVLPDRAYQESVGYESLQADKDTSGSSGSNAFADPGGASGDSPMVGQAMTTGGSVADERAAGTGNRQGRSAGRQGKVPAGAVRGDGSGTCPAEFPIKGNANSRIYHRPSDTSYENTIPEFCFATEADAKAAGFRARKG